MKKIWMILAILGMSFLLHAQDTITMKDGTEIKAKVLEVNIHNIRYKRYDNIDGPVYTIDKNTVFMLKYANGTKDVFPLQENSPSLSKSGKLRHFDYLAIDGGQAIMYNKTTADLYNTPYWYVNENGGSYNGFVIGLTRQWGYFTTNRTAFSIGAEIHTYNGKYTDNIGEVSDNIHVIAAGVPVTFSFTDTRTSNFYFEVTLSPGVRYTYHNISNTYYSYNYSSSESQTESPNIQLMGRFSASVGYSFKTTRAIFQIGPYLDYIATSSNNSAISHIDCYGIKVGMVHLKSTSAAPNAQM
jgi:hypothetical protein